MSSTEFAQEEVLMPTVGQHTFLTSDAAPVLSPLVDFLMVGGPVVQWFGF